MTKEQVIDKSWIEWLQRHQLQSNLKEPTP